MGISVSGSSASFVDGLVLGLLIAVLAALVWTTFSAKVRKPETLFNGVLATATLALAFVSILQWLTLGNTDRKIGEQVDEMVADRRPFIGISDDEIVINKPLTFNDGWATIQFKVTLRNVGKSVAAKVSTHLSLLQLIPLTPVGRPRNVRALSNSLRKMTECSEPIVRAYTEFGVMILPGGSYVVDVSQPTT
jgi:hypothetical protein